MKFYVLNNPKSDETDSVTDYEPVEPINLGDAPKCNDCGSFIGMLPLIPPIQVEVQLWGSAFGDIVFGTGDQILITKKLLEAYRQRNLSGINEIFKVDVTNVKSSKKIKHSIPEYFMVSITHSNTEINDIDSSIERDGNNDCNLCGIVKAVNPFSINESTWAEEDIFFVKGLPGRIIVSEFFLKMCEEEKLHNIMLVDTNNFYWQE